MGTFGKAKTATFVEMKLNMVSMAWWIGTLVTLKSVGLIKLYFGFRRWPVNICKFKYVHHGHFGTLQSFLRFTVKFWRPWEVDGPSKCCQLLTLFGIFDPLIVKISTLPPLCFMIYYIIYKLIKYKELKIPPQKLYPPSPPPFPLIWGPHPF